MNDAEQEILDAIKTWVWSGFHAPTEVDSMIDEMLEDDLEDDVDEGLLRAAALAEFDKKRAAEKGWPSVTDCDRLDKAFAILNGGGVIAIHNAGYTMSDGHEEVAEALQARDDRGPQGYCFYHGQDLERALAGEGLMLAFGGIRADRGESLKVGQMICQALRAAGLGVAWAGDPETRISLPSFDWKRRAEPVTTARQKPRPWWRFW